jgi:two-component system, LytTR family, sensor kinase
MRFKRPLAGDHLAHIISIRGLMPWDLRALAQEIERAELLQALMVSELHSLKTQLHAHFLFNALQGISTLTESDPCRAKAMILKLSGLLRAALRSDDSNLIALGEELKSIEDYLDLEEMRLGERLQVRWNVQPETRRMLVPQLILQPLVENAIVHGIACCREGGWIQITATRIEPNLKLIIRNSTSAKGPSGLGIGLENTRARLKRLYADEGDFSLAIDPAKVATATLRFPGFPAHGGEKRLGRRQRTRSASASCGC